MTRVGQRPIVHVIDMEPTSRRIDDVIEFYRDDKSASSCGPLGFCRLQCHSNCDRMFDYLPAVLYTVLYTAFFDYSPADPYTALYTASPIVLDTAARS